MANQHSSCVALALLLAALFTHDAFAGPVTRSVSGAQESRAGHHLWLAQVPPQENELQRYTGIHAAAANGDTASIARLVLAGANVDSRDFHGRTPLMVAA